MRTRALLLIGLAVAGAAILAWGTPAGAKGAKPVRLAPFRSCGALLDYSKLHGSTSGVKGGIALPPGVVAAPSAAPGGRAGVDFSTTNVQEGGVDEPDLVKTDGSRIYTVTGNTLYAVQARGRPKLLGSLALPEGWGHQLLLFKQRLLVLSSSGSLVQPAGGRIGILPSLPTSTVLSEVDLGDDGSMHLVRTLTVEGSYLTARQVGSTVRLAIASTPRFVPPPGPGPAQPGAPTIPSKAAIASSKLRTWLPYATLQDRRTGRNSSRPLVQCRQVRYPPIFSGLGMVSVLTIDLDQGLSPVDSDAVMMGAGTVYASPDRFYVATQRWLPVTESLRPAFPSSTTTEIHAFDSSKPGQTRYVASGSVPGFLLNQWSLSEYNGALRVASSVLPLWFDGSTVSESHSFVTVLAERTGKLVQVGQVGGLGRGQRVYAVRFLGDRGFVVTFRQVDPLYTLALDNPADPKVLGALDLLGYSAYLHPIGAGLLLGVGQDATDQGRLVGSQVSLFDVGDPRHPTRLDMLALGSGGSEIEYDAHAFLYWPQRSLAVVPVQISSAANQQFAGAVVLRIGKTSVKELGRISHPDAAVRRALVVGDRLYTVSDKGVEASNIDTLAGVEWIPFSG
jgi:hypothetical protein